ncbi:cardiolipin synthase [Alicyclobacillus fastidiosus]|uniref:Cardiolipin synthase n=1 Tax=Alicyclobacillus fastidiosus TaxID=392011 RepID=A0ABY6ZMM1_9BACL|nr:cardiolipin synthase [Alicyclobacillus fastidiosus]WAH44190.1 cardiolipin synthase [Alicyclobacillus fastidiosus]GMA60505.1 major cardiolipin synthase ClsA [Alicyclobacillus fastidiosus]
MVVIHLIYYLIFAVDVLTAIAIIFLERQSAAVTWAWLMVLLFIPILGFFMYLLLGPHFGRIRMYRVQRRNRLAIEGLREYQKGRLEAGQMVYTDPDARNYQGLIYMNLVSSYGFFTQDNEVEIFTEGHQKFESLLRAIEAAKDHIHLEYYILRNDRLGQRLLQALVAKARSGVTVRLLYDAVGSTWTKPSFFQPLIRAGGHVAAFFPSKIPYMNFRMNHRNHRKLAIIDGVYGYIGGFNIGDEYLGLDERFGEWRDTHLRVVGSCVLEMQAMFYLDWNFASKAKMPVSSRYFQIRDHEGDVGMQIVSSGPNSDAEQIRNAYIKMIHAGKDRIYIQSPYFVPDESLLTALKTAALSGVDVRIMLPSKPDHRVVYWASRFYLGELLSVGVKCYLYEKGFLHAKTIVVDGKIASVGTANIDIRSFKLNFEVNAMIYNTKMASRLMDIFEQDLQHCEELTMEQYRARPRLSKIAESCARLLSPIL